jgi:hypothetical protein
MKIILLIMLTVFALDLLGAVYFMHAWLAGGFLFLVLAAMFALLRTTRKHKIRPAETGWCLGPALEISNPDRPTPVEVAVIAPDILNLGMLFIGGPGAGKTESATLGFINAMPIHSPGCGWVYFEGKGDIDIYKKCVAMGNRPQHFFSSELPGSDTINLFSGEAHDVVDRLCKVLIGETASTSFYSDEQRAVLARVVPLLRCLPQATNLRDLYVALSVEDAGNELLRRASAAGANAVDIELARGWFSQPIGNRLKNVSGLLNRLFIFVNGPYADRLNAYQPDIEISKAIAANESIYLHLPLTSFAKDVAIAIIETFGVEARKRQLAGTENLKMYPQLFDDWGAFFHIGFGPYSARCRSAGMPLSFGFQSRAQLDAVGSSFADELDDTIATKIILRVQGDATSQYAVRLLGQFESHEVGTSESSAGEGSSGTSLRYMQRARIEPRQLRELQAGEAYISTLAKLENKMVNPLWKLRLPLPDFGGWQNVSLPPAREHVEGEGLSLWSRYMNPARLAEIHATVQIEAVEAESKAVEQTAKGRDEARADMVQNPGLNLRA